MIPTSSLPLRPTLIWALLLATATSHARITRIEFSEQTNADARQGVPESYRVLRGHITGELSPDDIHNRIIQDIALASRNSRAMVEYTTTFTLYAPIHPTPQAALLYEVVNRGASIMPREYSNGDYFLISGWQGDIPFDGPAINGSHGETIRVPVAHDKNGSSLTGPVLARFFDLAQGQTTLALRQSATYSASGTAPVPNSLDTKDAELITKTYEDVDGTSGGISVVPASEWLWGNCSSTALPGEPDATKLCLKHGADPKLLYELHYIAKDPLVLGVGLAAIRDVVSFFRYGVRDDHGVPNPVSQTHPHTIIVGISQSGNLIRSFLNLGFNQDEENRQVFDGAFPIIAARQVPINVRFGVPGGTSMLFEIGTDGAETWIPYSSNDHKLTTAGLLDRCAASHTCPKIIELLGSTEFWSLRTSLSFTGTSADQDVPLPDNVRRYYLASTQHGGGSGIVHWQVLDQQRNPECVNPTNPNPMVPTRRALLAALKAWVIHGQEPPPSNYPRLADHTLASSSMVTGQFPLLPGSPRPHSAMNPNINYDLGPGFRYSDLSGIVATQPPAISGESPSSLPAVNEDGNEIGGIHTVMQQVPLGTYLGWNVVAKGFRKGQFCSLTGSYIPFPRTAADRIRTHDPRLSLEERYRTHEEYVNRVRKAASAMTKDRFLLEEDAEQIIERAEDSDVLR